MKINVNEQQEEARFTMIQQNHESGIREEVEQFEMNKSPYNRTQKVSTSREQGHSILTQSRAIVDAGLVTYEEDEDVDEEQ